MGETADAKKQKYGAEEALKLARSVEKIVAAKGASVTTLDLKKDQPDDAMILAVLMGPTGNLRAPTARVGKTLLVGFNPEIYSQALGIK